MAYTDPNTGITRDKYGNEVRDPTGTASSTQTSWAAWVIAALFVAALLIAIFGMGNSSTTTTTSDTTVTEPLTPKAPPPPAQ
jgi:hypothetical protein